MAVRSLLHYALEVPDQTVGEKFYRNFGLVDEAGRDGAVHLRPAPLARETVRLYPGPKKRLHHLAFGAPGDEFAATQESLRRAGVSPVDPPRGAPEARRATTPSCLPAPDAMIRPSQSSETVSAVRTLCKPGLGVSGQKPGRRRLRRPRSDG